MNNGDRVKTINSLGIGGGFGVPAGSMGTVQSVVTKTVGGSRGAPVSTSTEITVRLDMGLYYIDFGGNLQPA